MTSSHLIVHPPILIPASSPAPGDVGRLHPLGCLERLMPRLFPVHLLFAFPPPPTNGTSPTPTPHTSSSPSSLQTSLARTLNRYPQMAGRYQPHPSPALHLNNAGAVWVDAEIDPTHPPLHLRDLAPSAEVRRRETPAGFSLEAVPRAALVTEHVGLGEGPLLVQVTRLSCGGLLVDVSVDHALCDAKSYFHFVSTWAQVHRGMAAGQGEDAWQRLPSYAPPLPGQDPLAVRVEEWRKGQSSQQGVADAPFDHSGDLRLVEPSPLSAPVSLPFTRTSYHHFSSASLQRLKARLTLGLKSLSTEDAALLQVPPYLSTQDALLSHLWSVLSEVRQTPPHADPHAVHRLRLNLACHNRLIPPLPATYAGPAAILCPVAVPHHTACAQDARSLRWLVWRAVLIRRRVLEMGQSTYLCSLLHHLDALPAARVREVIDCIDGPDVMSTSWSGFGMYGCDWGWGAPAFVMKVMPDAARNCLTILSAPGEGEAGDLDVCVKLSEVDHQRLVSQARMYDFEYA